MKLPTLFLLALASQLHALDPAGVTAIAGKFDSASPDEQYSARMELYRAIDNATAPGKGDAVAVTRTLVTVMQDAAVSDEAKKYILRALTNVSTVDAVDMLSKLVTGSNELFRDEARQVLESIHDPKSVAVLEAALGATKDKVEKIALANSLAMQKASSSVALLAPLTVDSDPEVAVAGIQALARIGGSQAIETLQTANASSKITPALKEDVEEALIIASSGDVAIAQELYQSTKSDTVRAVAFLAIMKYGSERATPAAIESALESDNAELRHAAIKNSLRMNLFRPKGGITQAIEQMPLDDRLVVLANIRYLKPAEAAEKIALSRAASTEEDERVAALVALGEIGTQPAFAAVLQAIGEKTPRINQTASTALASMDYADAEVALLGMLKGDSSADKILAIKAVVSRQVPGANEVLIDIITGSDDGAAREAMKSLYFVAGIDDLRTLSAKAAATEDAARKKSLTGICSKIAKRINTDEAKALVEPLN